MHEHIQSLAAPVANQNGLLTFYNAKYLYNREKKKTASNKRKNMNDITPPQQYDSHMAKKTSTANLQA
jgi:hypothetical protein